MYNYCFQRCDLGDGVKATRCGLDVGVYSLSGALKTDQLPGQNA